MEYRVFTCFAENVYKSAVWNIAVLHSLMKMYIKLQYGIYNSFTYFDEAVYKPTIWNIAVLHTLMKMYIKPQYGIQQFHML